MKFCQAVLRLGGTGSLRHVMCGKDGLKRIVKVCFGIDWGRAEKGRAVGRMNYRRAEGRRQSRIVEKEKDVEREDLWRFVMNNVLISLSIDNRLY
jgi:hypothetical protein